MDRFFKPALLGVLLTVAVAVSVIYGLPKPARVRAIVENAGPVGGLLVVLGIAVLLVLLAPRAGVAAGVGAIFGVAHGIGYVWLGSMLAAVSAFGLGRVLGRDGVRRFGGDRAGRMNAWLNRNGFLAVFLARLTPIVPFGLLNVGFGTTDVRLRVFFLASAIGVVPGTVGYVAAGSAAAAEPRLALVATGVFAVVGIVVAIVVRLRRRAAVESPAPSEP